MSKKSILREHLRMKIVETLIRIEHLPIMNSDEGFAIFGKVCEMAGRCCVHVAADRYEDALKVAETVGMALPHAFPVDSQRTAFEEALNELIFVLEKPEYAQYH